MEVSFTILSKNSNSELFKVNGFESVPEIKIPVGKDSNKYSISEFVIDAEKTLKDFSRGDKFLRYPVKIFELIIVLLYSKL